MFHFLWRLRRHQSSPSSSSPSCHVIKTHNSHHPLRLCSDTFMHPYEFITTIILINVGRRQTEWQYFHNDHYWLLLIIRLTGSFICVSVHQDSGWWTFTWMPSQQAQEKQAVGSLADDIWEKTIKFRMMSCCFWWWCHHTDVPCLFWTHCVFIFLLCWDSCRHQTHLIR